MTAPDGFDPEEEGRRAGLRAAAGLVGAICAAAGISGIALWLNEVAGLWAGSTLFLATGAALLWLGLRGWRT